MSKIIDALTIKDTVTGENTEYKVQDTVTKERVDMLTSLPAGATTNDAALADIAVGYDGTMYTDADGNAAPGEAVRKQIIKLDELEKENYNSVFDKLLYLGNKFIPNGDIQLFNKIEAVPTNLMALISKGVYDENKNVYRCFTMEINGKAGEVFSFNYCGILDFEVKKAVISVSNDIPKVGEGTFQIGSCILNPLRGMITLSQDSKYISVMIEFLSKDDSEAYTERFKNYLVVRKSNKYSTEYVDFHQTLSESIESETKNNINLKESLTLKVGNDVFTDNFNLNSNTGWVDNGGGSYTHNNGTNSLVLEILEGTAGSYIVSFSNSSPSENSLFVKFGNDNDFIDSYTGSETCVIGFVLSTNKVLTFKPMSSYSGTISNIKIYKINDGDNNFLLPYFNNIGLNKGINISGFWNVSISPEGLQNSANCTRNISIGKSSMPNFKTGNRNIAIGTFSLGQMIKGERNIAIGSDSMYLATEGYDNVSIGKNSMVNGNDSLSDNVSIGNNSMGNNVPSSTKNVAIGSLACNYAHELNVGVGYKAGYYSKGNGNTSVGSFANDNTYIDGNNNTAIGYNSGILNSEASSTNIVEVNNSIAIGYNSKATKSNQMVLGSNTIEEVVIAGKVIHFNSDGTVTWSNTNNS